MKYGTTASQKTRFERAQLTLVHRSAPRLIDDMRQRLVVPIRQTPPPPVTATFAELISEKVVNIASIYALLSGKVVA